MAAQDGVIVTFEMELKPEVVEGYLANAGKMLVDTAKFPGYRKIRIVQNKDEPNRLLFIEHWDSEEDYRKYIAWRQERGELDRLKLTTISTTTRIWPNLVVDQDPAPPEERFARS